MDLTPREEAEPNAARRAWREGDERKRCDSSAGRGEVGEVKKEMVLLSATPWVEGTAASTTTDLTEGRTWEEELDAE
jgi:hypothetical protein